MPQLGLSRHPLYIMLRCDACLTTVVFLVHASKFWNFPTAGWLLRRVYPLLFNNIKITYEFQFAWLSKVSRGLFLYNWASLKLGGTHFCACQFIHQFLMIGHGLEWERINREWNTVYTIFEFHICYSTMESNYLCFSILDEFFNSPKLCANVHII